MDTQVSVTTQSAPFTASSGSEPTRISTDDALIQSISHFFGLRSGGEATRRRNSKRSATGTHDTNTLLASPDQATVLPRIEPRCSSNVITSASTWQGCERWVRPLITGTVAC